MFTRIFYPLLGIAYWQKGYRDLDANQDVDKEFARKIETPLKTLIMAMVVIGVVIDIVTWRCRTFAKWIIFYECVSLCIQSLVPFRFGDFTSLINVFSVTFTFVLDASELGKSTMICTATILLIEIGLMPMLYTSMEHSVSQFLSGLLDGVLCFSLLTIMSMLGTYVALLRGRMDRIMTENLGLLNRMYEGLIVLRTEDGKLSFASKPAIKILKGVCDDSVSLSDSSDRHHRSDHKLRHKTRLGQLQFTGNQDASLAIDEKDIHRPIFTRTNVSINK